MSTSPTSLGPVEIGCTLWGSGYVIFWFYAEDWMDGLCIYRNKGATRKMLEHIHYSNPRLYARLFGEIS